MKKLLIILILFVLVGCKTEEPNSNSIDIRPPLMNTNDFIDFEPMIMPTNNVLTNSYFEINSEFMICSGSGSVFRVKNEIGGINGTVY